MNGPRSAENCVGGRGVLELVWVRGSGISADQPLASTKPRGYQLASLRPTQTKAKACLVVWFVRVKDAVGWFSRDFGFVVWAKGW
jgi:hypothetical protein